MKRDILTVFTDVRKFSGLIFSGFALLSIINLRAYTEFFLTYLPRFVGTTDVVLIAISFLPFVEFFIGLLIIGKIHWIKSLWVAYAIMSLSILLILVSGKLLLLFVYILPKALLLIMAHILSFRNSLVNFSKG